MGKVSFAPDKFAFPEVDADRLLSIQAVLGGDEYTCSAVSMGNPHCVIFVEDNPALAEAGLDLATLDLEAIGSTIEYDAHFPERTNVEFVHIIDDHTLLVRVWERGSGETLACGSGACAAAAAAIENGYCSADGDITVHLTGGALTIAYNKETADVYMTGEAVEVYRGTVEI
jgi:carbamoyl-phosphate synthase large subunit